MTSIKLKIEYALFLVSFLIWLSVFFSVCFPAGKWSTPLRFPDSLSFTLFFGSAIVTSISTIAIGLEYMELNIKLNLRHRGVPQLSRTNSFTQPVNVSSNNKAELNSAKEEEAIEILILPKLEEEQISK